MRRLINPGLYRVGEPVAYYLEELPIELKM
jgi:hypothetical protein